MFTVIIQFGSILALMWLYRARLLDLLAGLPSRPESRRFALMLLVALLPALAAGVFLEDFVKEVLYESPLVIAVAFIAGGVVMLVVERNQPAPVVFQADRTPIGRALAVGACQ